jgi:hypothetical protein
VLCHRLMIHLAIIPFPTLRPANERTNSKRTNFQAFQKAIPSQAGVDFTRAVSCLHNWGYRSIVPEHIFYYFCELHDMRISLQTSFLSLVDNLSALSSQCESNESSREEIIIQRYETKNSHQRR